MISLILHGFGLGNINIILWQQTLSPSLWMLAVRSTGFLPTPYAHLYVFSIYCRIFKRQTWWLRLSLRILTSNTRSLRKLNRSGQFFVVYPILCSHIFIVCDCNQLVFFRNIMRDFFFHVCRSSLNIVCLHQIHQLYLFIRSVLFPIHKAYFLVLKFNFSAPWSLCFTCGKPLLRLHLKNKCTEKIKICTEISWYLYTFYYV